MVWKVFGLFCASVELPGPMGNAFIVFECMSHSIMITLKICQRYVSGELFGSVPFDTEIPFFSQGRDVGSTHRPS